jgi:ubiquitin-protein ligase
MAEYRVPRNFKLLEELEHGEKGNYQGPHAGWISLGLDGDDLLLSDWNATIIGPQDTNLGDRIYTVKVHAGEGYPDVPPVLRFVNKINMECVDNTGLVTKKLAALRDWNREMSIFDVLCAVRESMASAARLPQPSADATY